MRRFCAISILIALTACSSARPPAATPELRAPERLAEADRLLRAGCLDCLIAAYGEYDLLRTFPSARQAATAGAVRSAALIALRERELGYADEGYSQRARALMVGVTGLPGWMPTLLDIVDALPASGAGATRTPTSDIDLERARVLRINHDAWSAMLRNVASIDEAGAYAWLAFTCDSADGRGKPLEEVLAPAAKFRDTPLIAFKAAVCRGIDTKAMDALFANDPRWKETRYYLGLSALGQRKLDDADKYLSEAYGWRQEWPTLTQSIANVAMTAEDFDRALAFYEHTLAVVPRAVDALLGKTRALTMLGRPTEAIATTDQLLAERWFVGDARYWRALNELELEDYETAWADVEAAAKLLINAEVPKLAGLIAYRRQQLDVSRAKFEESMRRNPRDCETAFYLGIVLAESRVWDRTAVVLVGAAQCLEAAERGYRQEIAEIQASTEPPARKASKIARREQYIAKGRRQMATSFFNTAVSYYNLQQAADARTYAEKVVDDEQFGARAKEILARLR